MGTDKLLLPRSHRREGDGGAPHAGGTGHAPHAGLLDVQGVSTSAHVHAGLLDVQESVLFHVMQTAALVADSICLVLPPDANLSDVLASPRQLGVPVQMERDRDWHLGPLQALQGAWANLDGCEYVYVIAADLPGLTARVLTACRNRFAALEDVRPKYDGVVVVREGRWQPLLGYYRFAAGRAWSAALDGETRVQKAADGLNLAGIDERLQGWPGWWTKPIHTQTDYAEWLRWSASAATRQT